MASLMMRTSFALSEKNIEDLEKLASLWQVSKATVIRHLLTEATAKLGDESELPPPKSKSASVKSVSVKSTTTSKTATSPKASQSSETKDEGKTLEKKKKKKAKKKKAKKKKAKKKKSKKAKKKKVKKAKKIDKDSDSTVEKNDAKQDSSLEAFNKLRNSSNSSKSS